MIGVVLAGGRSTRLGQDKVRLRLPGDGRDMLARTADLLAACTDGVVISCRAPDAGEETLALPGIRSIPDAKPGLGPARFFLFHVSFIFSQFFVMFTKRVVFFTNVHMFYLIFCTFSQTLYVYFVNYSHSFILLLCKKDFLRIPGFQGM